MRASSNCGRRPTRTFLRSRRRARACGFSSAARRLATAAVNKVNLEAAHARDEPMPPLAVPILLAVLSAEAPALTSQEKFAVATRTRQPPAIAGGLSDPA